MFLIDCVSLFLIYPLDVTGFAPPPIFVVSRLPRFHMYSTRTPFPSVLFKVARYFLSRWRISSWPLCCLQTRHPPFRFPLVFALSLHSLLSDGSPGSRARVVSPPIRLVPPSAPFPPFLFVTPILDCVHAKSFPARPPARPVPL